LKKEYDILVIGSGLGGLVSALVLAKEGLKVCVLEKNNQYGGNLQTFSRDKLIFDTGVHYLGGLSKGQNLNRFFSYLEIMDDLELQQMDEDGYDRISFEMTLLNIRMHKAIRILLSSCASIFLKKRKSRKLL
jgi:all-trans-retinol 13,14-reductase